MSEWKPYENPAYRLQLQEPIMLLGQTIKELAIRKPTPGDMLRIGLPVKHDMRDNDITFDERKSFAMLAALTNIPVEGHLDQMTTNDAVAAFWAIVPFFIAGLRTKAEARGEATSTKPGEQPAS